jgi:hypothetical protein
MPELADALTAADVRDTAAQIPRDDRAGFWHAMHPVATHPVAPVAPIARTPTYDINAF